MSAGSKPKRGYMVCSNVRWPALGIQDTVIAHCDETAAELHGYGAADLLAGKRLSEVQSKEARKALQCQHLLREHGYPTADGYCTIVHADDGEEIGHYRQLVKRVSDGHGGLSYAVIIERVKELAPVAMPDIALYGLTEEHFQHVCGKLTVQQLKDAARDNELEKYYDSITTQNLRIILERCRALSMHFSDTVDETGVDIALSGQVSWTLYGKNAGLVKVHQTCTRCGWHWYGDPDPFSCPQCRHERRARPAVAERLGSGTAEAGLAGLPPGQGAPE